MTSDYTLPGGSQSSVEADIWRRQAQIMTMIRGFDSMLVRFAEMLETRGVFKPGDVEYIKTGEEPLEGFGEAKWGHAEKLLELSRG